MTASKDEAERRDRRNRFSEQSVPIIDAQPSADGKEFGIGNRGPVIKNGDFEIDIFGQGRNRAGDDFAHVSGDVKPHGGSLSSSYPTPLT